ncbi:carbohydrate sulfotransferase 3-like [Hyalella azteca]|uniref:Carbohydrate sulfotransferase 3-like n=1 Tax=Hyalella azteca TaxID=294128 RepID=A0A979FQQ4_HYAAZ|nr:carbohydrate sulfotransferase 3-like [Hyalella azteca]
MIIGKAINKCKIIFNLRSLKMMLQSDQVMMDFSFMDFCFQSHRKQFPLCAEKELHSFICKRSKNHLLKVVTLKLSVALDIMKNNPNLDIRIVHLVRDPRGILASSKVIVLEDFLHKAEFFCSRTRSDLETADILRTHYPDKYILVRYEDLAMHPLTLTRKILKKLGEQTSIKTVTHVQRITKTMAVKSNEENFATSKLSTSRPFQWRKKFGFSEVLEIQKTCGDVLTRLQYRIFNDEEQYKNASYNILL